MSIEPTDDLYAELRKTGDKIQALLNESDVQIVGFVVLGHDGKGNGTADVRHLTTDTAFRAALYGVADNLRPVNED